MQVTNVKARKICGIIFIFVCLFVMALSVDQADEWPSGGYGLPKPRSGCPGGKKDGWNEGWRFQDMEDIQKSDRSTASSGIHMDVKFISAKKDVKRTFCMKRNTGKQTKFWPDGSYCIYKGMRQLCPRNMITGWVKWDDEDYKNKNKAGGSLPDGSYNKDTVIRFCCQNSGNWYDSIELPVSQPFYLLTSNSVSKPKCQMVKWAFSYLEYVVFDTNHPDNKDEQGGQHVFLHGRKLYYCYYEDCRRKLTGPSGSFRSHPLPVNSTDPHSQYCSWSITVAETHVVSLKLKELMIPFCGDAFLKIYDGLNDTVSLLGIFCGANATKEVNISSTTNNLYVVSNSVSLQRNPRIRFSFVAEYSAENKSHPLTSMHTTRSSVSKRPAAITVATSSTILTSQNVLGSNCKVKERPTELNRRTAIIVAATVGAGMLLIIALIVLLVKLKRRKQPLNLSTLVDVPLGSVETSPKMLPTDLEPNTVARTYDDDVITNTTNDENAPVPGQEPIAVAPSGNGTSEYETPHEYEEPIRSLQYPIYTALDKTKRKNSDEDNYQKLLKPNSDYVTPAHERQEPEYEDVKPGGNLPGYTELDQMKRETAESQESAYQKLI